MPSILPTIPYFVFAVLEPLSLVAAVIAAFADPAYFVSGQAPQSRVQALMPLTNNTRLVVQQLGNIFGLMALMGVAILNTTRERATVRAYLYVLATADLTHIGLSLYYMGQDLALDPASWNAVAWGNVGFTFFLFVTRTLYLTGVLDNAPRGKTVATSKKSS